MNPFSICHNDFFFFEKTTQRIELFKKNMTLRFFFEKKKNDSQVFFLKKTKNFSFLNMTHIIELFLDPTDRIEHFLNTPQRIEPLISWIWRKELNRLIFENDSQNWTFFRDSKNWTFFLHMTQRIALLIWLTELFFFHFDSQNWTFSWTWLT